MITGGFAPSAWRVQKVCPLAIRSFSNFALPCSPPQPQPLVTVLDSRTAGSKSTWDCAHMPDGPNADSHPPIQLPYFLVSELEPSHAFLLRLPALGLRTSADSEFGPKKSPWVGKVTPR